MIRFIICVVFIRFSEAACATTIWEGQSHNLTCAQQDGNVKSIAWSVILPQGPKSVIVCQASSCTCIGLTFNFCQHISSDGCSNFNCTIQFKNVTRDMQYTWICTAGGVQINTYCDFQTILAYPKPALDESCPTGLNVKDKYILKGTNASCTCKLEIPGIPSGNVQWFKTKLGDPVDQAYRANGTNLNIEYKDKGINFICKGISPANNLSKEIFDITYTPQFAYGPENVNLSVINTSKQLQICANETILIQVSCEVAITDINPSPQFSVYLKNNVMPEYTQGFVNVSAYTFQKDLLVNKSGDNQIICSVRNSIFSQLQLVHNLVVTVNEPPADYPFLKVKDPQSVSGSLYSVIENKAVNMECSVKGGTPNATNITVTCDSWTETQASNFLSTQVTFNRKNNSKICSCKASHITGCYDRRTNITLNVLYQPSIVNFTANSKSANLTVKENANVSFICLTESNPEANVSLYKMNEKLTTNSYLTTTMFCNSTGEYMCYADNDIISPTKRYITVTVECALRLQYFQENYKEIYAEINSNANFNINVYGFPAPLYYTLYKNQHQVANVSVQNLEEGISYTFAYVMDNLPFGHVIVMINNITQSDFGNYTLNIYNGIQSSLDYSFALIEGNFVYMSPQHSEEILIPAVVGGIASFVLLVLSILVALQCKNFVAMNYKNRLSKKMSVQEYKNEDLYFYKTQENYDRGLNYKNYSDIATTTTSAAAFPKNLKIESSATSTRNNVYTNGFAITQN